MKILLNNNYSTITFHSNNIQNQYLIPNSVNNNQIPVSNLTDDNQALGFGLDDDNQISNDNNQIPVSAIVFGAIALSPILVSLPAIYQNISSRKTLTPDEKDFIQDLMQFQRYSQSEVLKIINNASDILKKLTNPKQVNQYLEQDFLKFITNKYHINNELKNDFKKNIINHLSLYLAQLKHGFIRAKLEDIDGNRQFKNFYISSHASQTTTDNLYLSWNLEIALDSKLRGFYKAMRENNISYNQAQNNETIQQLIDIGLFKTNSLNNQQIINYFSQWFDNQHNSSFIVDKNMHEVWAAYDLDVVHAVNTARQGIYDSVTSVLNAPNYPLGINTQRPADAKTNMRREGQIYPSMRASMGRPGESEHPSIYQVKVNGFAGPLQVGYSLNIPFTFLEIERNGLYEILEEGGFNNILKDLAKTSRLAENKGVVTSAVAELYKEVLPKIINNLPNTSEEQFIKQVQKFSIPAKWSYGIETVIGKAYAIAVNETEQKAWQYLDRNLKAVTEQDIELLSMPAYSVFKDKNNKPIITENVDKLKKFKKLTHNGSAIPIGTKHYQDLQRGLQGKKNIKEFARDLTTLHGSCFTFFTLDHLLNGTFATDKDAKKQYKITQDTTGINGFKPEYNSIEPQKKHMISQFFAWAQSNQNLNQWLSDNNYDCFIKADFQGQGGLNMQKTRPFIEVVNNSTYETWEQFLENRQIAQIFEKEGLADLLTEKGIYNPMASYFEAPIGGIDKAGAVISGTSPQQATHMSGDSVGTDKRVICFGILRNPLEGGTAVRKMQRPGLIKSGLLDQLDIYNKVNVKYIKNAEKFAQKAQVGNKNATKDLPEQMATYARNELLRQPLRYAEQYYDKSSNSYKDLKPNWNNLLEKYAKLNNKSVQDLTNKEVEKYHKSLNTKYQLIGTNIEELAPKIGLKKTSFATFEELINTLSPYIDDILMGKWTRFDDVSHKHHAEIATSGIAHDCLDKIHNLMTNPYLTEQALKEMHLENRNLDSVGLPPGVLFTRKGWSLDGHKGWNVFNPVHGIWLNIVRTFPLVGQSGALLGTFGALGLGIIKLKDFLSKDKQAQPDNSSNTDQLSVNIDNTNIVNRNFQSQLQTHNTHDNQDDNSQQDNTRNYQVFSKILNAGLFIQNAAWLVKNLFMSNYPQPISVIGSGINMVASLMPSSIQLPMYVAGTAFNMGGWSLNQSFEDQADVNFPYPKVKNIKKIYKNTKWDSKHLWNNPMFMHNGRGVMHAIWPGAVATRDQTELRQNYKALTEKKIPSFIAYSLAGIKQLGLMNWRMLTDWKFAHDMLKPISRMEFVRGNEITMPGARSYLLSLGFALPLTILGSIGLASTIKKLFSKSKQIPDSQDNTDNNQPNTSLELASDISGILPAEIYSSVTQSKQIPDSQDNTDNNQPSASLELASDISGILPAAAAAIYAPAIKAAAFANPFDVLPIGVKAQYRITPKLNGNLVQYGSLASIAMLVGSTASTLNILPPGLSPLFNLSYLGLQGFVTAGLVRNAKDTETISNNQTSQFFPKPDPLVYEEQKAAVRKNPVWRFITNKLFRVKI